jgi:3'(2'), 5'-bisphosphate nucleotidase
METAPKIDSSDAILAERLARAAGQLLSALRAGGLLSERALGATGDAVSNRLLLDALARHRPDDALLSEESVADPARLTHRRVWVVDPLDGTREFGEGREDWAVHVALCVEGTPRASAVAIPARGQVFTSEPGLGTALPSSTGDPGRRTAPAAGAGPLRIAVSRSRPPAEAERVAGALGAELVRMGSAGIKAMAVVTGEVDAYLHAGGQYEWDSAAPVGVAAAAGLHASRIDGSPLRYNRPDPLLPDLLICRPELAGRLLAALADPGPVAA